MYRSISFLVVDTIAIRSILNFHRRKRPRQVRLQLNSNSNKQSQLLLLLRFFFLKSIHVYCRESTRVHSGTQVHEHEDIVQVSPSVVRKTTTYESHRSLGTGQSFLGATSTGHRTPSPAHNIATSPINFEMKDTTTDEGQVEENYEVTISTLKKSEETGLAATSDEP